MKKSLLTRAGVVAGACALVGAGAGIAGSAASPTPSHTKANSAQSTRWARGTDGGFGHHRVGGPPVHAQLVVLNRARTSFITVTADNGTVKTVSGNDVTITEASGSVTYKDATITLPDNATVYRNDAAAKVGDLKAGDHVRIAQSSDGTFVFAEDAQHDQAGPDGRHHGHHGPDGPGGPPPGGFGG